MTSTAVAPAAASASATAWRVSTRSAASSEENGSSGRLGLRAGGHRESGGAGHRGEQGSRGARRKLARELIHDWASVRVHQAGVPVTIESMGSADPVAWGGVCLRG
ncbi:hypothetical protein [Paraburkholderia sp. Cpub6]|uniref:hypothetical protein n=1 Tax=Paraburkholderia sp. Cpub6 TaxID=2723094 RepID=UPI00161CD450|nr:hypothetical protein [Paraburkholderia sp. Cpub6]MBB5462801.1 hypothetical protein [Paraburkholderia sp. Cpub6]